MGHDMWLGGGIARCARPGDTWSDGTPLVARPETIPRDWEMKQRRISDVFGWLLVVLLCGVAVVGAFLLWDVPIGP